jgi:beta-mannanase
VYALAGCDSHHTETGAPNPRPDIRTQRLAIPKTGAYLGAYIDWGEKEDAVALETIDSFEQTVGKRQAIIASSSYWGEQNFPEDNVRLITNHGSVPFIFWSPWDKPYIEGRGPDKYSITSIIEGKHDAYIDLWAEKARAFGGPIMVSFANEMNGSWFPWSGLNYGGSSVLPAASPKFKRYEGPETFKKAYRHVVDRVRAKGAGNIQWVLHLMNYSLPQDEWNLAPQYYPGRDYCDWLGFSLYGAQFADDKWADFFPLFEWPYQELQRIDPTKPVMVCEWGVGDFPGKGRKAQFIRDGLRWMKDPRFPNLKACVYWHERWQNEDSRYSNLRVNSTPESLAAYRDGVANPFYLGDPIFEPAKR